MLHGIIPMRMLAEGYSINEYEGCYDRASSSIPLREAAEEVPISIGGDSKTEGVPLHGVVEEGREGGGCMSNEAGDDMGTPLVACDGSGIR